MSETATAVTPEHFAYLSARTRGEDAFLGELKEAARAARIPAISIGPAQASLLQILLKAIDARAVLEVGTLAGYSAIAMARALPADGRVTTIEIEPKHADFAQSWADRSDVAGKVRVLRGSGQAILPTLADRSFDAAFLDADKGGYPYYLEQCLRLVRPRGLVLVDNAFAFGELFAAQPRDRETRAVRAFNDLVPTVPGLHAVIVPIGDGMWVGVVE